MVLLYADLGTNLPYLTPWLARKASNIVQQHLGLISQLDLHGLSS